MLMARLRTANFSLEEEEILLFIVEKYADIVECKRTDHINNRKKEQIWSTIANDFNAQATGQPRSQEALKTKYLNLKKKTKKKFAEERIFVRGTGGGPPQRSSIGTIEQTVSNILGETRIAGRSSTYDDDKNSNEGIIASEEELEEVVDDPDNIDTVSIDLHYESDEDIEDVVDKSKAITTKQNYILKSNKPLWKGQTTPLLRTKISTPLRQQNDPAVPGPSSSAVTKKRIILQDQMSNWARGKAALNELQERIISKEHEQRLEHKRKEHEVRLQREERIYTLQEEELKLKIAILQEEFEIKRIQRERLLMN